jgi:hypothetical protein
MSTELHPGGGRVTGEPDLPPSARAILEQTIRPLVTDALVAEHRERPLGPHSPALRAVMNFVRSYPARNRPRYVLLREHDPDRWGLGALPGEPGGEIRPMGGERYETRGAAEHGAFLQRLDDLGLRP